MVYFSHLANWCLGSLTSHCQPVSVCASQRLLGSHCQGQVYPAISTDLDLLSRKHLHRLYCDIIADAGLVQTQCSQNAKDTTLLHLFSGILVSCVPRDASKPHADNDRTVAISCIRLRFVAHSIDPTWTNIEGSSWSLAELSCALICACLPTLKPVLSRCIPALSFRVTSKHSNRRPGNIDPESPKNPLKVHGKTTIITVDDGTVPTFNTLTVNGSQEALVSRQHKQDRNMTTTFPEFKSLENPWNYIPQAGLDQAAEARLLKRQLDLGLAVTTQTEITHDPRNLAVPQDGTIRIEREVITYTR